MKTQISKLYGGTPPYTQGQSDEIAAYKSPPFPQTLVTVRTGNRKLDATMTKVLNRHPKFREAAERIHSLTATQAKAIGLRAESKADQTAISKLFDGVKPYDLEDK